ncbi:MAG: DUF3391 domain-containing protein, partial [Gammaproteobacteria bacterium]|nr:DUF3391 domain-containing protein [Gammaproteobacteria bacterium]
MLKKVSVSQLKIGMYIHDLNRLWFNHPFAFNQFFITEKEQLSELLKNGIKEVTIDTSKELPNNIQAVNDAEQFNESNNNNIETNGEVKDDKQRDNESLNSESVAKAVIPLARELKQAKVIKHDAVKLVKQLMDDIRLGKQVKLEKLHPVITKIIASIFRNHDALLGLTRIRNVDEYTYEHSVSVAIILTLFAKHLGFNAEELKQFCLGGLLVDLGKIKIPQSILTKAGKLTAKEYDLIKNHVAYGIKLVKELNIRSDIVGKIMLEHHERLDGSGYPNHKSGPDISLFGHMAAIIDTYD